mgnify:CR=1 FL=1
MTHRYALARYARAQAELGAWRVELLALDFIFDRAPRSETWEGWGACTVVSAGRTDGVAAARAARARGAGADAIIASLGGAISNLQLAPGAEIAQIYPLEGNEGALGFSLLASPVQRDGAIRSIDMTVDATRHMTANATATPLFAP